jgi:ribosomal protein S18 acetylase RimI-like enzyme
LALPDDRGWATELLERDLGGRMQARRNELLDALDGQGLAAELDRRPVGLITWVVAGSFSGPGEAEVRALVVADDARSRGAGSALLREAVAALSRDRVRRAWLVTTNDNVDALGFYQRRGWRLAELHAGGVDAARRLKPAIPRLAANGIAIRDELVLAIDLAAPG